jgi:hypothetical protein
MIAKLRKNMKNGLMHIHNKIYLKKRAIIKTVNDELENICKIQPTRHRSFDNFLTNLLSVLIASFPTKPLLNFETIGNFT